MNTALEKILFWERDFFFMLNGSNSGYLDHLMWTYTGRFVWIPLFVFILCMFFYRSPKKEAILVTVFFILLFIACDQVSSSLFKPFFHRFRPTHHPDFQNLVDTVNGYRGGLYGFVSGHATNSFGIATFVSLLFKNKWVSFSAFLWAILNAYSRVYLGVHFISDIVGGMVLGILLALIAYQLLIAARYRLFPIPLRDKRDFHKYNTAKILAFGILIYIAFVAVSSPLLYTLPH